MEDTKEHEKSESKSTEKSELLKEILANIQSDIEADVDNQKAMLDDLKFCSLDQWPSELRASRENDPNGARPCLTIDQSNQYITQVVNDIRQNRPAIKTRPVDDEADVETAKVYQGLIRHIEDKSSAYIAYETSAEWAAKTGRGYFRIVTEYEEGSFDQEPRLKHIPDALSVYMSPHTMPDGSDAIRATIIEEIPVDEFKHLYPDAKHELASFSGIDNITRWRRDKTITVAEHFYFEYEEKELFFLADGTTIYSDKFDGAEENIVKRRKENVKKVKWCKLSGAEILEETDWLGIHIPVIEVIGKESVIEGKRILWGLVRPIKDNLRMYNYWASASTEKIALSPKAPFIIAAGQEEGFEDEWAGANTQNRPFLRYKAIDVNGNAVPPPQRVMPAAIETAMHQMMGLIKEDTRAALGMYKASVGDSSSQQSGRALLALQRESDTGTLHYSDNLARSLCYAGRQLVDIIPKYMDTRRVIRILGDDGESKSAIIDPSQKESRREIQTPNGIKNIYNLGVGKYDVTVTVGPSYNTKRMEAAQVFTDLANSSRDPGSSSVLNYLAIKNSDVTSSDEAIVMLKALLPPQALQAEEQGPVPPQVMAQMQQMQQQMQVMQEQGQELQQENQQLKSGAQEAQMKVQAGMQESQLKIQAKQQETQANLELDQQVQSAKLQLEREAAMAKLQLERDIAAANLELEKMKIDATADSEVDQAIATVKNMVAMHETNMGAMLKGEEGGIAHPETDTNSMMQMHTTFMEGIQQVVEGLNQKKTISMVGRDGTKMTATVQ